MRPRLPVRLLAPALALALVPAAAGAGPAGAAPGGTRPSVAAPAATAVARAAGGGKVRSYPVPTAAAGLGRITTAPDGTLWFVERDAHKVGRVAPDGKVSDIAFPSANAGPQLVDLDVSPDGSVWVVYDSGRLMLAMDRTGRSVRPVGGGYGFADTLAGAVRVAPDGVVWNTLRYPATGQLSVARTFATGQPETPADGAPACDGPLAAGTDGAMWCRTGDTITRMANPPQGSATLAGTPYLAGLGRQVSDLAAGPVGSIWFARTDPATGGQVGYVDQATGAVQSFSTGVGSNPVDLVAGPDGRMWFVDGGARPGIGYVDAAGRGALLSLGDARPTSLTLARDGSLWFTDATRNVVSRVATGKLPATTRLASARRGVKIRGGKVVLRLRCAATAVGGCAGPVRLRADRKVRGKRVVLTREASYALAPGTSAKVTLTLTRKGRAVVRRGVTVARVESAGTRLAKVRLRR